MATGGSGDVLTGMLAGLTAQRLDPTDAAVLGVYLHGLSGDLAARELGMACLTATNLLEFLPDAMETIGKA
jgi:NAD(P)H-hydrate epimerase